MALAIPTGYGSAAFIFSSVSGTAPFVTTCGVDLSAAGGDFVAAADSIFNIWKANILPIQDSGLTLDRVTLAVGQDGPGGSVDSTETPSPGLNSVTSTPFAVGAIMRKVTNRLGRPGRGRMFVPGLVSNSQVDEAGTILPARQAALNAAFEEFRLDMFTLGTPNTQCVLLHGEGVTGPPEPIQAFSCSDLVGIIRGRIR